MKNWKHKTKGKDNGRGSRNWWGKTVTWNFYAAIMWEAGNKKRKQRKVAVTKGM